MPNGRVWTFQRRYVTFISKLLDNVNKTMEPFVINYEKYLMCTSGDLESRDCIQFSSHLLLLIIYNLKLIIEQHSFY